MTDGIASMAMGYKSESPKIDTVHVLLSDLHSASNYALFLNRIWQGLDGMNHAPNSVQIKIRDHWDAMADRFAMRCDGKRIRLIMDGDAIEGFHHSATDVATFNPLEQSEIHVEIVSDFQRRIGWKRGDEIYYVKGTKVHTEDWENWIGNEMNAVMTPDGYYAWDFLPLETNGALSWFVHAGAAAGDGDNEGNVLRNVLKRINSDAVKDHIRPPDIVYFGHVHKPTYNVHASRDGMKFRLMHAVILPSMQVKTRYAWGKAPISRNKIGAVTHEIKADGSIAIPEFDVMITDL